MVDLRAEDHTDAIAVPDSSVMGQGAVALRRSLRTKSFLAIVGLLVYVIASVTYISVERAAVRESVLALQQLARHEKALTAAHAAVATAMVDVNEASSAAAELPIEAEELALHLESCAKLLGALDEFDAAYAVSRRAVQSSYQELIAAPVRANWIDLRETIGRAADDLEIRQHQLVEQREALTQTFRRRYDAVTVESLALALAGVMAFGYLVVVFIAQLTRDIRRLESHARRIVQGERGVVLPVLRNDELGSLMQAVNRLAVDLDEREKRIEIDNQRRAHHEKMSAMGALAAGVAHEVNNALAVIAGVAQQTQEHAGQGADAVRDDVSAVILAQTQRASQAARHLAELAQPQPAERDWIDVNVIVGRVIDLMRYDKRYRATRFESALSHDVPAVYSSGEAVQHVLMRLLSLGSDAAAAQTAAGGVVRIVTLTDADARAIEIVAEFPAQLDFNDAAIQRSLLLTRSIIEPLRGRLALTQDMRAGLRISLTLPVGEPGMEQRDA